MQLSAYSLARLRDDGEFILYRAHAKQTEPPSVLLLAPTSSRPRPETLKKIDHEYSLRSELDPAWAVRPLDLSDLGAQTTLVLEDPGGETLDGFINGAMEMTQFLRLAVELATAIGALHAKKLIHKDVKPANILVNPPTGQVRLMGFGVASRLRREHQAPDPPEFIAGTLPYMAPEQTGRINRSVDQLEPVDLNHVIDEMVMMMEEEATRHAVTIHTDVAQGVPNVLADRVQLQQALMNLMLNGVEATPSTGGELRIKSQLAPDGQLLVSISDTGVGIPPENLDKIFNAFFTTKTRGTGLGLPITRSIIQSHGGRIWATANTGPGTTFAFILPQVSTAQA